jgi:hypothetical protein
MSTAPQYEFSQEQNAQMSDLSTKMRFVGQFSLLFGLAALLIAVFTMLFIFRDRLPPEVRKNTTDVKLPEAIQKQLEAIPSSNTHLWGIAIFAGLTGAVFALQGAWTWSASASFQKIVSTQGNDIGNLMSAVSSLQHMYGQIYLVLKVALVAGTLLVVFSLIQLALG